MHCFQCRENGVGSFDFTLAQTRLSKAAMNSEVLYRFAAMESHFLEPYGNLNIPAVRIFIDTREDETAREIMRNGGIEGYAALQW